MFKVFNRGHKFQFSDATGADSTSVSSMSSIPQPTKITSISSSSYNSAHHNAHHASSGSANNHHYGNKTHHTHLSHHRRQSSMRHSHFFIDSDELNNIKDATCKLPNGTQFTSSKKYVSCENVRHLVEEYQEVSDGDEIGDDDHDELDENGLKEKFLKRYTSLTTLLMKSFRKAKNKKKKDGFFGNESKLETNYEDKVTVLNPNRQVKQKACTVTPKTATSSYKRTSNNYSKQVVSEIPSTSNEVHKKKETLVRDDKDDSNDEEDKDDDEDEGDDNENENNEDETIQDDNSTPVFIGVKMISNEFVDLKPPSQTAKPNSSSNTSNTEELISKKLESLKLMQQQQEEKMRKAELQKQQELKHQQAIRTLTLNSKKEIRDNMSTFVEEKKVIAEKKTENGTVKKVFSSHMKQQAPKLPNEFVNSQTTIKEEQLYEKHQPQKQASKEQEQESGTIKLSNATVKRSKTFTQQLQDMLKDRRKPGAPGTSDSAQAATMLENCDFACGKSIGLISNNNYKSVSPLSSSCSSSPSPSSSLSSVNHKKLSSKQSNETSESNKSSQISDDFKELVNVLARQDSTFKKKFFDCLMTKLWDTNLPYSEYLQLNKLMTALFGESYHKIDLNKPQPHYMEHSKTSKMDAEHIVNLMKMYLESKTDQPQAQQASQHHHIHRHNDEFLDLRYSSVSNLINTLKRRQRDEKFINKDEKIIEDDSFINGKIILKNNTDDDDDDDILVDNGNKLLTISTNQPATQLPVQQLIPPANISISQYNDLSSNNNNNIEKSTIKSSLILQLDQKEDDELVFTNIEATSNQISTSQQAAKKENMSRSQIIMETSSRDQDDPVEFVRNRLRRTLGSSNNNPFISKYNSSNLSKNTLLISTNPSSSPKAIKQNLPDIIINDNKYKLSLSVNASKPVSSSNDNFSFKRNNSLIKSSGIIASFQPSPNSSVNSQTNPATAMSSSSNGLASNGLLTNKRSSSLMTNTATDSKKEINVGKIYREQTPVGISVRNTKQLMQPAQQVQPPKPKIVISSNQADAARKIMQIRNLKELFRNGESSLKSSNQAILSAQSKIYNYNPSISNNSNDSPSSNGLNCNKKLESDDRKHRSYSSGLGGVLAQNDNSKIPTVKHSSNMPVNMTKSQIAGTKNPYSSSAAVFNASVYSNSIKTLQPRVSSVTDKYSKNLIEAANNVINDFDNSMDYKLIIKAEQKRPKVNENPASTISRSNRSQYEKDIFNSIYELARNVNGTGSNYATEASLFKSNNQSASSSNKHKYNQFNELLTNKIYKFDTKEMQQAFY